MAEAPKVTGTKTGASPTVPATGSNPALPSGWKITTLVNVQGVSVYQAFDAQGEYIASHVSEAALLRRLAKRNLLPQS